MNFSNRTINIDSSATCTLERQGIKRESFKVPGENINMYLPR